MPRPRNLRRIAIAIALLAMAAGSVACENVAFYEKAAFSNPLMTAEEGRGELHWRQKVHYSREAAIGGMGKTAGGGCGCY